MLSKLEELAERPSTGVHAEMVHLRYKAPDKLDFYVRVVMLDFSKAFNLINHHLPSHIVKWMTTFLSDGTQRVIIGNEHSHSRCPNGGVSLFT